MDSFEVRPPPQSRIINRLSVDSNEGNVDSAETIHGSPMG